MKRPLIAPSILSADFARLADEISAVEKAGADLLHLDVMDGSFVPNLTFGPLIVEAVNRISDLTLDVHLMINAPEKFILDFKQAGADWITFHYEAANDPVKIIELIKSLGLKAGISIKPQTPVKLLSKIASLLDLALIMTVEPGFGGQGFLPGSAEKIREMVKLRESVKSDLLISIDGGVKIDNCRQVIEAGADILVAGSAVFKHDDPAFVIKSLKNAGINP